jgi:hypothetical protein
VPSRIIGLPSKDSPGKSFLRTDALINKTGTERRMAPAAADLLGFSKQKTVIRQFS